MAKVESEWLLRAAARLAATPTTMAGPVPDGEIVRRRASVSLVLRPGPELLLIRRSQRDGDPWSGHMALPGGHVDAGDRDEEAAALRETHEEVGLDLESWGMRLGRLDDIVTRPEHPRHPLTISAFVYGGQDAPELVPNHEVAGFVWVPLVDLGRPERRGTLVLDWRGERREVPAFPLGDATVWGFTLRIIDDLLVRLRG
jgi:8-oxo-dGTP pyrophosphatase MutT (NUDIX family)